METSSGEASALAGAGGRGGGRLGRGRGGVLDRDGEGQRADLDQVAVLERAGSVGQRLAVDQGPVAAAQVADR